MIARRDRYTKARNPIWSAAALGRGDLSQLDIVRNGLEARLQRQDLVIAAHNGNGLELEPPGVGHRVRERQMHDLVIVERVDSALGRVPPIRTSRSVPILEQKENNTSPARQEARLAESGDPLIRLAELIEFEVFRSPLLTALARSDGNFWRRNSTKL